MGNGSVAGNADKLEPTLTDSQTDNHYFTDAAVLGEKIAFSIMATRRIMLRFQLF